MPMTDTSAKSAPRTPSFIIDEPAKSDAFSPHQRIADSVIEVIQADNRIKLIGLLGGWGSGKSTAVQLIEQGLRCQTPTTRTFTFDAWENQSDPPRRAFLEALAFFLRNDYDYRHLKDHEKIWRADFENLNRQRDKKTTRTTPLVSKATALFVISLIAMTAGLRLVGGGTVAEADQTDPAVWAVYIFAVVLTISPLLVALGTWLSWRHNFSLRKSWLGERKEKYRDESLLGVLSSRPVDEREELVVRSPEPTVIDFQRFFRKLVVDARPGPRFVIVVDNLDRLPPEEAMTIWSTVRSLFLGSDDGYDLKRDELPTVIMPVDDIALRRIYKDKTGNDGVLAQSFIDKTFHLVFHVPPPVLSRWHSYLRKQLTAVFRSDFDPDWPHAIASAYEAWLAGRKPPTVTEPTQAPAEASPGALVPTPREINALVNAIAVLWMQRRDEAASMEMIAYFAIWRREIDDLHHHLEEAETRGRIFSESQKLELAALTFGVKLEDASELFLDEPLRQAIEAQDPEKFGELLKYDRHVLRFLRSAALDERYLQAYFAADLLKDAPGLPSAWAMDAWSELRHLAIAWSSRNRVRPVDMDGLDALVENTPPTEIKGFIIAVGKAMSQLRVTQNKGEAVVEFAAFAKRLAEHGRAHGLADFTVSLPGESTAYAEALGFDIPTDALRVLTPGVDGLSRVIEQLGTMTATFPSRRDIADRVQRLLDRGDEDLDWSPLMNALTTNIDHARPEAMPDVIATLFNLYLGPPVLHSEVGRFGVEGRINAAHQQLWQHTNDAGALATATALLMRLNRPAHSGDHRSWQDRLNEQPELPGLIHQRLTRSGFQPSLGWLTMRGQSYPDEAPLLSALAATWIDDLEVDLDAVFNDPGTVNRLAPPEALPAFWRRVSQIDGFWDHVDRLGFEAAAPIFRSLRASEAPQASIMRRLNERLRVVPEAEWIQALEFGQEPLGLVAELSQPKQRSTSAGVNAHNALVTTTTAMIQRSDEAYRQRWFTLARKLTPASRSTLARQTVLALLTDSLPSQRIREILSLGGTDLLDNGDFAAQADRVVTQLVLPLIADDEAVPWLFNHMRWVQTWVAASSHATRKSLQEQLANRVFSGDLKAQQLAAGLGVSRL